MDKNLFSIKYIFNVHKETNVIHNTSYNIWNYKKYIKYLSDNYNCWHKFNQRNKVEGNSHNT